LRFARGGAPVVHAETPWSAGAGVQVHWYGPCILTQVENPAMLTHTTTLTDDAARRRIVLIDFDWADADLLPELLKRPDVSVRLVAGQRTDDAGMRVAELCGLPRTVDLADLTREIFDLALVGERSARRTQVEGLLQALGTPCASPQNYLQGSGEADACGPAIEAPLALHAAALEDALGGHDFDDIMERTLPDMGESAPTTPQPVQPTARSGVTVRSLEDFPSPHDRMRLKEALTDMAASTGAGHAQFLAGRGGELELLAQVGPDDPLLRGLVEKAVSSRAPQVVSQLSGPEQGKAWGAWPFQTTSRSGVVAAAGINPAEGWTEWERMVGEIRSTWDRHDREIAAPAFPLVPDRVAGWLDPDGFMTRLDLAVERNQRDGLLFSAHRFEFPDAPHCVEDLCQKLPLQLRDTDCICHPQPRVVLMLTAGPISSFPHVRRRLLALWEQAWHDGQQPSPAPPITGERVDLSGPENAAAFVAAAGRWLERL
jgi:hypothetical protein